MIGANDFIRVSQIGSLLEKWGFVIRKTIEPDFSQHTHQPNHRRQCLARRLIITVIVSLIAFTSLRSSATPGDWLKELGMNSNCSG